MSKGIAKVSVEVRKGDINKALKIFKRRGFDSGHIQKLKDRKTYVKPTTSKRREKQKAVHLQKLKTIDDVVDNGNTNVTTPNTNKKK